MPPRLEWAIFERADAERARRAESARVRTEHAGEFRRIDRAEERAARGHVVKKFLPPPRVELAPSFRDEQAGRNGASRMVRADGLEPEYYPDPDWQYRWKRETQVRARGPQRVRTEEDVVRTSAKLQVALALGFRREEVLRIARERLAAMPKVDAEVIDPGAHLVTRRGVPPEERGAGAAEAEPQRTPAPPSEPGEARWYTWPGRVPVW